MPQWTQVVGEHEVFGGFLSASLIFGGFLIWTPLGILWFISAPILIVIGILMLMDDVFPYGRQPYLVSESSGFIAGIFLAFIAFFFGYLGWILGIVVLFAVLKISLKMLKKVGRI